MNRKLKIIVPIFIILITLFTSYGYAALNTKLSISGEAYVRVAENIRVTNLKLSSITSGGEETYNSKFSKNTTSTYVTLPSKGEAIYEVEVTNNSSDDYFLESVTSNNSNYEFIDTKIYDTYSKNTVKKFYIKITNNETITKDITLNIEYKFVKDESPTITLNDLPKWNTKGDEYALNPVYTSKNGGTAKCKSNLNTNIENVTDLKQLTTTGNHNITCTVTSNTGKTASVTKTTKITYDPYNTTNIIKNGSFENGTSNWSELKDATLSNKYSLNGNYSLFLGNPSNGLHNYSVQPTTIKPILNHKYYGKVYYYSEYSFPLYTRFEWFHNDDNFGKGLITFAKIINVNNTWQYSSNVTSIIDNTYLNDNWEVRNFGVNTEQFSYYPVYTDNIMIVDLTATFGAGLEPDQKWCDKHIKYFDGTTIIYK